MYTYRNSGFYSNKYQSSVEMSCRKDPLEPKSSVCKEICENIKRIIKRLADLKRVPTHDNTTRY